MLAEQPIGLFDSGVGGLTVAEEIFRQLPAESIIYFGDTAHVPYGSRKAEELISFADDIVSFLLLQGVKIIVDACNSTSSVALPYLKKKYSVPIIGVVEPGVELGLKLSVNRKIGLIATEATIKSGAHKRYALKLDPTVKIYEQACPLFVPLVEAGEIETPRTLEIASKYLAPLKNAGIDTLILGCTHYPFLAPVLRSILGPEVTLVDPAVETVNILRKIMWKKKVFASKGQLPVYRFYVSGDVYSFKEVGGKLIRVPDLLNSTCPVNLDEVKSGWVK